MGKTSLECMIADLSADQTKEQLYIKTLMLEKKLDIAHDGANKLINIVEDLKKENRELKKQIEVLDDESAVSYWQEKIDNKTAQIGNLKLEILDLKKKLSDTDLSLDLFKARNEELKAEYNLVVSGNEKELRKELKERIKQLESRIKEQNNSLKELEHLRKIQQNASNWIEDYMKQPITYPVPLDELTKILLG